MKISIAQKIRPFSHRPGASCLIPGTCAIVQAFPALLRFGKEEYETLVKGPVKDFTLLQDLEKNCVFIFGKAQDTFYRFRLQASDGGFELFSDKTKERQFFPASVPFHLPPIWERLSLGSHKAQDWDLVMRRADLREILPVLFGLGQKIPLIAPQPASGTAHLLNEAQLKEFCLAAFSEILVPQLSDVQHLGLLSSEKIEGNPFFVIQEAVKFIRALFFRQNERRLEFLPSLLFPEGRLIHVQAPGVGEIDLEWASRELRRVLIRPTHSGDVVLVFQKEVRSFRVKSSSSMRGKKYLVSEPLFLEAGKSYLLDCFQK